MNIKVLFFIPFILSILSCSVSNRNSNYKINDVFNEFGFSRNSSQDFVKDVFVNGKGLKLEYENSASLGFTGGTYWDLSVDNWSLLFNHFSIYRLSITFSNKTNLDTMWNYLNSKLEELYKWKASKTDSISTKLSWIHLSIFEKRACRNYFDIELIRTYDDNDIEQIKLIYYNSYNQPKI